MWHFLHLRAPVSEPFPRPALKRFVSLFFPARALLFFLILASLGCTSPPPGTIGALLGKRTDGRLFVRGVPADEGAAKAGIEVDDEILAIDGRAVTTMTSEEGKRAVRGDVGTKMVLTIERDGQRFDRTVERGPLLFPEPKKP